MNIDMHFHSNASDWLQSKEDIIKKAVEKNMDFIRLTDHDVVSYWFKEMASEKWISSCESVEISANNKTHNKSLHLTFYAKNISNEVNDIIKEIPRSKVLLIKKQIEFLNTVWFWIDLDDFYSAYLQKWRKKQALNKFDIVDYIFKDEALKQKTMSINKWIDIGREEFYQKFFKKTWERFKEYSVTIKDYEPTIEQCKIFKEKSNAILSIAHPNITFRKWWIKEFLEVLPHYIEFWWINAIEINAVASKEWVQTILEVKAKYNLFLTFWSDNHKHWYIDNKHWDFWDLTSFLTKKEVLDFFLEYRNVLV